MTINSTIAIIMIIFVVLLFVSTVMVSVSLFKEIKRIKSESKASSCEEVKA